MPTYVVVGTIGSRLTLAACCFLSFLFTQVCHDRLENLRASAAAHSKRGGASSRVAVPCGSELLQDLEQLVRLIGRVLRLVAEEGE